MSSACLCWHGIVFFGLQNAQLATSSKHSVWLLSKSFLAHSYLVRACRHDLAYEIHDVAPYSSLIVFKTASIIVGWMSVEVAMSYFWSIVLHHCMTCLKTDVCFLRPSLRTLHIRSIRHHGFISSIILTIRSRTANTSMFTKPQKATHRTWRRCNAYLSNTKSGHLAGTVL